MDGSKWTPGRVVWRELMTTDVDKAKGFYGELFGWRFTQSDMGDFTYTLVKAGDVEVAGIMGMPPGATFPPHWLSYVSVENVDKAVAAAKACGGQVLHGPMTIPEVGVSATLADADGAGIAVMRSEQGDLPAAESPPLHTFCWETISTKDPKRAQEFYAAVMGWKTVEGPGGAPDLPVFATLSGAPVADLQVADHGPAHVATYVVVDRIDASVERATSLGARIVVPRFDMPRVGAIAFIADPTGGVLGLFQPQA